MLVGGGQSLEPSNNKRFGFTLAEVLITLGIIGVVAALTLPTLISKYKKHVLAVQTQSTISILENGFRQMMANDGVDSLLDTEAFKNTYSNENPAGCQGYDVDEKIFSDVNECKTFVAEMNKYFNIVHGYLSSEINYGINNNNKWSQEWGFVLNNGAFVYFSLHSNYYLDSINNCDKIKSKGGNLCNIVGYLDIDVNGNKSPNINGYDVHGEAWLGVDGKIYPFYGKDSALFECAGNCDLNNTDFYWRNDERYCGVQGEPLKNNKEYDGHCLARMMENGWKIDY